MDRAAAIHTHLHAFAGVETLRRQRPQHGPFFFQPVMTPWSALREQLGALNAS